MIIKETLFFPKKKKGPKSCYSTRQISSTFFKPHTLVRTFLSVRDMLFEACLCDMTSARLRCVGITFPTAPRSFILGIKDSSNCITIM